MANTDKNKLIIETYMAFLLSMKIDIRSNDIQKIVTYIYGDSDIQGDSFRKRIKRYTKDFIDIGALKEETRIKAATKVKAEKLDNKNKYQRISADSYSFNLKPYEEIPYENLRKLYRIVHLLNYDFLYDQNNLPNALSKYYFSVIKDDDESMFKLFEAISTICYVLKYVSKNDEFAEDEIQCLDNFLNSDADDTLMSKFSEIKMNHGYQTTSWFDIVDDKNTLTKDSTFSKNHALNEDEKEFLKTYTGDADKWYFSYQQNKKNI